MSLSIAASMSHSAFGISIGIMPDPSSMARAPRTLGCGFCATLQSTQDISEVVGLQSSRGLGKGWSQSVTDGGERETETGRRREEVCAASPRPLKQQEPQIDSKAKPINALVT